MAHKYFTSDLHFGSSVLLDKNAMGNDVRPFTSLDDMHIALQKALARANDIHDTIYHLGDFCCIGNDRTWDGLKDKSIALTFFDSIKCNKIFIEGNHDKDKLNICCGKFLIEKIGKYYATLQHRPSFDEKAIHIHAPIPITTYQNCPIYLNICGHCHNAWKVAFDNERLILNVNVGIDRNNFKIYSEPELINLIRLAIKWLSDVEYDITIGSFDEWYSQYINIRNQRNYTQHVKSAMYKALYKPELLTEKDRKYLEHVDEVFDEVSERILQKYA